jgi:hypothetical protein
MFLLYTDDMDNENSTCSSRADTPNNGINVCCGFFHLGNRLAIIETPICQLSLIS